MIIKLLRFTLMSSFTIAFLLLCERDGYTLQRDSRNFPSHSKTTITVQTHEMNHSNQPTTHFHPHEEHRNHTPTYFYYINSIYPAYTYPVGDDSFYYSAPLDESNSNNDDNTATSSNSDHSSLPNGTWTSADSGNVPDKAFVYQMENGSPTYYCRVQYKDTSYYGVLTPGAGCYIQDQSAVIRFNQYDVLISSE